MVEVVEQQQQQQQQQQQHPHPDRLDSVDSGISDESDSASSSVSPDRCSMDQSSSFFVAEKGGSCTPAGKLRKTAFELALDLVLCTTGEETTTPANRHCRTLRRLCHELSTKHEILFASLIRQLDFTANDLDCRFLENVADKMFADKRYNWGRIVTFYAFAARLARHCVENRMSPEWPERIAHKTGEVIAENAGCWISNHGGWDAMTDLFTEPDNLESKIWKGLLYTVIGLGALATTVAVVR